MKTDTTELKIYVACLSSYNNGFLHGAWIDVTQGYEDVMISIYAMLKEGSEHLSKHYGTPELCEEWAIHDYDLMGIKISESEDIHIVCALAETLKKAEDKETGLGQVLAELYEDCGELEQAERMLEDHYLGCYAREDDFIYQYIEDCGFLEGVSKFMQNYIDYDAIFYDMKLNGDILQIDANGDHYFFTANF